VAANDSPSNAGNPGARYVIRGSSSMGLDPQVGDFPHDALVEAETIAAVGSNLAAGGAAGIDASGRIVMPELIDIDAHHRQLERYGVSTNYNSGTAAGSTTYNEYVFHRFAPEYRAHAYINELSGALGQINEYAAYRYL
jgi:5-methylthioadenosine/S-adenosylhomocysteine deaminase